MDNLPYGLKIIESSLLTVDGEPYEQKRTWVERLFTRPWNPMKKTKTVIPKIPDQNVVIDQIGGNVYMHPEVAKEFRLRLIRDKTILPFENKL